MGDGVTASVSPTTADTARVSVLLIPRFVRRHAVDGLDRENHPATVIE